MTIRLNAAAVSYARSLIRKGAVDSSSPWTFVASDGDALLGSKPDWEEYGHAFLGIDDSLPPRSKGRFHYPFAKRAGGQVKIFVSALRAIRSRAAQQGARDIFDAAGKLLAAIKSKAATRAEFAATSLRVQPGITRQRLMPAGRFEAPRGAMMGAGPWNLTAAAAQGIIDRASGRGTDIPLDYEHQILLSEQNGKPAPAAGWLDPRSLSYEPDAQEPGLYGDIKWTDKAAAAISSDEYRYLSPVFTYDPKTGEPIDLHHLALTNVPGIDEGLAAALSAAHFPTHETPEAPTVELAELIAMLGLAEDATEADVTSAIAALTANRDHLAALRQEFNVAKGSDLVAALRDKLSKGVDPAKYVPLDTVNQLRDEIAALRSSDTERTVDDLVTAALSDGRLLKTMEPWARELGKKDIAALKSYIEASQPIAALKGTQTNGKAPADDEEGNEKLTDNQLAMCKAAGISVEDFIKYNAGGDK